MQAFSILVASVPRDAVRVIGAAAAERRHLVDGGDRRRRDKRRGRLLLVRRKPGHALAADCGLRRRAGSGMGALRRGRYSDPRSSAFICG